MSKRENVIWGDGSIPRTFELLERLTPLELPLIVETVADAADAGVGYDGHRVLAAFHVTMPYGSVQLRCLTGYGMAAGFQACPRPASKADRAEFHNALISVFFELTKFNDLLAQAYKTICMPQALGYVDEVIQRAKAMDEGAMN